MYLNYVKLINFRNFQNVFLKPDKKISLFYGRNGQGKTNIAESIYIIFNGKSFRKCKRDDLIYYEKEFSEIRAEIEIEKKNLEMVIRIERNKRKLNINEKSKKNQYTDFYRKSLFLNSDLLFYFKNFVKYRIALLDKLCFLYFGEVFQSEYRKYKRVIKQFNLDKGNRIWLDIFSKQKKKVCEYRRKFLENVKEDTYFIAERMKIGDAYINYDFSEKTEFNFLRRDKKDLSLGEYKSMIFSLIIGYARKDSKGKNVLIIDDFNSEWDNERISCAVNILNETNLQCFLMSSEFINIYPHYLVEKGEVKKYG